MCPEDLSSQTGVQCQRGGKKIKNKYEEEEEEKKQTFPFVVIMCLSYLILGTYQARTFETRAAQMNDWARLSQC